jgi:hypothetical protein
VGRDHACKRRSCPFILDVWSVVNPKCNEHLEMLIMDSKVLYNPNINFIIIFNIF